MLFSLTWVQKISYELNIAGCNQGFSFGTTVWYYNTLQGEEWGWVPLAAPVGPASVRCRRPGVHHATWQPRGKWVVHMFCTVPYIMQCLFTGPRFLLLLSFSGKKGGGLHSLCNSVSPNFTNTLCYIMINRLMDVGIKIEGLNDWLMLWSVSGAAYRSRLISLLCDKRWPAPILTPMCLMFQVRKRHLLFVNYMA